MRWSWSYSIASKSTKSPSKGKNSLNIPLGLQWGLVLLWGRAIEELVAKGTNEELLERSFKAHEALEKTLTTFENLLKGIAPPKRRTAAAQNKMKVQEVSSSSLTAGVNWGRAEEETRVQGQWPGFVDQKPVSGGFGAPEPAHSTPELPKKPIENANLLDLYEMPESKPGSSELFNNLAVVDIDFTSMELKEEGPKTAEFLRESEPKPAPFGANTLKSQIPTAPKPDQGNSVLIQPSPVLNANSVTAAPLGNPSFYSGSPSGLGRAPNTQFQMNQSTTAPWGMGNPYMGNMRGYQPSVVFPQGMGAMGQSMNVMMGPAGAHSGFYGFQQASPMTQQSAMGIGMVPNQGPFGISPSKNQGDNSPSLPGQSNLITMNDGSHHLLALDTKPVIKNQEGKTVNNPNAFLEIDEMLLLKK